MTHWEYAGAAFGLDPSAEYETPTAVDLPLPQPGETLAVIGSSGAGKTLALRKLCETHGAIELPRLRGEDLDTPLLELFDPALRSELVLRNLARVGLADGRLWQLKARCLSAGECRRLQLALAMCVESKRQGSAATDPRLLVIDEFDAHLDSTTARVIACNLRRAVERDRLRMVVSTHRPETLADLQPARVIRIDHGELSELDLPAPADFTDEVTFTRGTVRDYARFAHWHYLGPGRPGPTSDVFLAMHEGRAVGIAMFGYPHLLLSTRGIALPEYAPRRIREGGAGGLNANVRLLQRVVIEPRFRGVGVARALIRNGLSRISVPVVECVAQMGAFSDFLLGAGFERVCDLRPPASVRNLNDFLARHGLGRQELLDDTLRGRLSPEAASELDRRVAAVVRTRIQTGFGSRRGTHELPPAALRKALIRIGARPGYFLWKQDATA